MTRLLTTLAALALVLGLAACSDEKTEKPEPTADPKAADIAKASSVHEKYWDIYVQMSNSGRVNPDGFDSVAEGAFVESHLHILGDQADQGITRDGAPKFGEFDTKVDGDKATSSVCKDETPWKVELNGKVQEVERGKPLVYTATLARRGDTWIITGMDPEEVATCP